MNSEWMKARQTRYSAYLATYLLVIIAILGATNWLASRYNKSFDSTSNKRFSLSDQTVKVVKNLNQDIKLIYLDENTRGQFNQARDLLDRYSVLSTRVKIEYIDPVRKPREAMAAGFRRETSLGTTFVVSA